MSSGRQSTVVEGPTDFMEGSDGGHHITCVHIALADEALKLEQSWRQNAGLPPLCGLSMCPHCHPVQGCDGREPCSHLHVSGLFQGTLESSGLTPILSSVAPCAVLGFSLCLLDHGCDIIFMAGGQQLMMEWTHNGAFELDPIEPRFDNEGHIFHACCPSPCPAASLASSTQ